VKIETIQKHLKGYFINQMTIGQDHITERLCLKLPNGDYEVCGLVQTREGNITAYENCLRQVNYNILEPQKAIVSLSEILPVIQGDVFEKWKMRQKRIDTFKRWLQCVKTESNKYDTDKYVVTWKKRKETKYGIVYKDSLTEIEGGAVLLDNQLKINAVKIEYPKLLRRALQDSLINEHESAYLEEIKRYNKI